MHSYTSFAKQIYNTLCADISGKVTEKISTKISCGVTGKTDRETLLTTDRGEDVQNTLFMPVMNDTHIDEQKHNPHPGSHTQTCIYTQSTVRYAHTSTCMHKYTGKYSWI